MNVFDQNNMIIGIIIGLVSPIIGFGLVYFLFESMVSMGIMDPASTSASSKRMRTIIIIALCTNVFWINKYNQPFTGQTLRGIIFSTMALCIGWFIQYYDTLYAED